MASGSRFVSGIICSVLGSWLTGKKHLFRVRKLVDRKEAGACETRAGCGISVDGHLPHELRVNKFVSLRAVEKFRSECPWQPTTRRVAKLKPADDAISGRSQEGGCCLSVVSTGSVILTLCITPDPTIIYRYVLYARSILMQTK